MKRISLSQIVLLMLPLVLFLVPLKVYGAAGDFLFSLGKPGVGMDQPYGIAVDGNGNVFVPSWSKSVIFKFNGSGRLLTQWGSYGAGNGQFNHPSAVAADRAGNVYVADTFNGRVQKFDNSGTYLTQWKDTRTGQLQNPMALATDTANNVYVANGGNIDIFDSNGTFLNTWASGQTYGVAVDSAGNIYVTAGSTTSAGFKMQGPSGGHGWIGPIGSGDGEFKYPYGIAIGSDGKIYVVDTMNARIQVFDSSGRYLSQWGSYGGRPGQFYFPYSVAVGPDGSVFVSDSVGGTIQKFRPDGTFLTRWGIYSNGEGAFSYPYGAAVDRGGNLYVTDSSNGKVQKFDRYGGFLEQWTNFHGPTGVAVDPAGNVYVADQHYVAEPIEIMDFRVQKFDATGVFLTEWLRYGGLESSFATLFAVAAGSTRRVYVSDPGFAGIEIFDTEGNYLGRWGSDGSGDGQFLHDGQSNPRGIAVDRAGNVYVADSGNRRIQKFDSSGGYIRQWGSQGTGDGQFSYPNAVAADGSGNIYVSDAGNARIEVFTTEGAYLGKWGGYGTAENQFLSLSGVAADATGSTVYVVDPTAKLVKAFVGFGTTHFSVAAPATAVAGTAATFTVTALNANNQIAVGYSGPVTFSSSDPSAVHVTSGTLVNGVGTFPITWNTVGSQTITATDRLSPSVQGVSGVISVTPPANQPTTILSGAVPTVADSGPDQAVELGVKFRSDANGSITGIRFYKGSGNTGTHVGNLWDSSGHLLASATFVDETGSGWQQVNFPYPVAIKANLVYIASYHTNVGHYSADQQYFSAQSVDNPPLHVVVDGISSFGSVYAYGSTSRFPTSSWRSTNYWVDVVFLPGSVPNMIWPATVVPAVADSGPDSAVEVGVKFRSDDPGYITGVRFYKGIGNTGTHIGNLWDSNGNLLASATFTGETAFGWQQAYFPTPVAILAGTTYIASYHTRTGHYSADVGYFAAHPVVSPPLRVVYDGITSFGSVFSYGDYSSYPDESWNSTNYYVDVTFQH